MIGFAECLRQGALGAATTVFNKLFIVFCFNTFILYQLRFYMTWWNRQRYD